MTSQPDTLAEFLSAISYLKNMYRLNIELLENLAVASEAVCKSQVYFENKDTVASLLNKANSLLEEIQADESKVLQYSVINQKEALSDDGYHGDKNGRRVNRTEKSYCLNM
jgi:hypothetical protein